MSLVYGVTDLQCAVNADVSLPQHRVLHLHWTLNKFALLRIITHQFDLETKDVKESKEKGKR